MNLLAVMKEVGDQIDTIPGLRVHHYPPNRITPPAAVVAAPDEYVYDETFGRGMDRITLPVVVMVGKVDARASWVKLSGYLDGAGPKSIKAVVEAGTYTEFDTVRATGVEFDVVQMASVDYLAAVVSLDIAGTGAA